MAKRQSIWLIYRSQRGPIEVGSWFLFLTSATISAPHEWEGRIIYRYAMSRHKGQKDLYVLWRDKNTLGRKFETRYFTTMDEAREAGMKAIKEAGS